MSWLDGRKGYATPSVRATEIFRIFLYLMQKAMSLMIVKLKVKSVYLLIHTGMGNSYLTFAGDSLRIFK